MSGGNGRGAGPLGGLTVVEVAVGVSDLGLGLAGGVPGMVLRDLGAEVVRVVGGTVPQIDDGLPWGRVWHRGKRIVATDDAGEVRGRLGSAEVALVYGAEELVEGRGLGYQDVQPANPGLVYARCRPSRTARGTVDDFGLLVEARSGFCTQLAGHRPGPIFVDVRAPGAGTAFLLTASVLALLGRRATAGVGGWSETSLYDGMLATLGCMIGRSERAPADVEGYWQKGSTFPNFLYRCADGELIQVWFGGKGMYAKLIDVLGDEPSTEGYYTDQATGALVVRAQRWRPIFATQPRPVWIQRLREVGVACEPVLGPGEALSDPHLAEIGLAVPVPVPAGEDDRDHADIVLGTPVWILPLTADDTTTITPEPAGAASISAPAASVEGGGPPAGAESGGTTGAAGSATVASGATGQGPGATAVSEVVMSEGAGGSAAVAPASGAAGPSEGGTAAADTVPRDGGLLAGVRVLDFSAFVAGPLAAEVLADLGADVIKVEPPQGEAMRGAAYAIAACQRGKRSIAMDITAPEARPVVERLIRWADVVLHNFRVGVSERLAIDEATVAELNPQAVYCHARAFGATGPRAKSPGNDALMQAMTGFERALGGAGNDPIGATWIPLDMSGGWISAAGTLAGLYARATTGRGQRVATSLLGAALLLHSGVFQRDGAVVRGPELDGDQTGYGPGYRLYQGGDGDWFALVVPDEEAWERLRSLPEARALPTTYAPLRWGPDAAAAASAHGGGGTAEATGTGGGADVHGGGGTAEASDAGRAADAGGAVARQAEAVLEEAFATAPAAEWVARLRELDLPVEPVEQMDRDRFRRGILDDPVNRQLGRVASYETADWGHFEQIGPLLRCGPGAEGGPPLMLPRVGEHSVDVLTELGFQPDQIKALFDTGVVRQL